jgi:hypothetical protein
VAVWWICSPSPTGLNLNRCATSLTAAVIWRWIPALPPLCRSVSGTIAIAGAILVTGLDVFPCRQALHRHPWLPSVPLHWKGFFGTRDGSQRLLYFAWWPSIIRGGERGLVSRSSLHLLLKFELCVNCSFLQCSCFVVAKGWGTVLAKIMMKAWFDMVLAIGSLHARSDCRRWGRRRQQRDCPAHKNLVTVVSFFV